MAYCRDCGSFIPGTGLVCQKCYSPVNQLGQGNSFGRFQSQPTVQGNPNRDSTTGNYENENLVFLSIQALLGLGLGAAIIIIGIYTVLDNYFDAWDDTPTIAITNENQINCNNWQEGRYWEVNDESMGQDKTCKGAGAGNYHMTVEVDVEVGDVVRYIVDGQTHCSVTITQSHIDREEASCR